METPGTMRSLMNVQTGQDSGDRKRQYSDIESYQSTKSSPYRSDRERPRDGYGRDEPPLKRIPGDYKRGQMDYQDDRWKQQGSYRESEQYSRGGDRRSDTDRNFGYGARDYDPERREGADDSHRFGAGRGEVSSDFFGGSTDRKDMSKQTYGRDAYDNRGMDNLGRNWYNDSSESPRDAYRKDTQGDLYRDRLTDTKRNAQDYYSSQRDQYQDYNRESDEYSQYRSDYRRDASRVEDYSKTSAYQSRPQDLDRSRGIDSKGTIPDARDPYQDRSSYSLYNRGEERQSMDYRSERYGSGRGSDAQSQPSQADTSRYDSRGYDQMPPKLMDQYSAGAGRYVYSSDISKIIC